MEKKEKRDLPGRSGTIVAVFTVANTGPVCNSLKSGTSDEQDGQVSIPAWLSESLYQDLHFTEMHEMHG
jgi:hypothetical protein